MNVYLFGSTTTTGQAYIDIFKKNFKGKKLQVFSRYSEGSSKLDLDMPDKFKIIDNQDFLLVSFAPIWKVAKFLEHLKNKSPEKLIFLKGIVACSSSSLYTKKFSFSNFDKKLYEKLHNSDLIINKIYETLNISICILYPTLIYGNVGIYKDKNINFLKILLKNLPILFIPSESGLRQPIHAYQLALVAFYKTREFFESSKYEITRITIGGDMTLSYKQILYSLNNRDILFKRKRQCLILEIPNRIYFFLICPLILLNPKWYAALLRLNSNLSGFKKVSDFTKNPQRKFPLFKSDFKF